jgi:hypothetical protein
LSGLLFAYCVRGGVCVCAQEGKTGDGKEETKRNPISVFGVTLDAIMKLQAVRERFD